jgi:hypothetical protein
VRLIGHLLVSAAIGVAAFSGAVTRFSGEAPMQSVSEMRCPNKIGDFKNSVAWYSGHNRVTVEATEACGTKFGESYELTNVTLDVRSGDRVVTHVHADSGTFFPKSHEVLVGKTDQSNSKACVAGFDVMTIDLVSGELRTPGFRTFLNTSEAIQCKKVHRHV